MPRCQRGCRDSRSQHRIHAAFSGQPPQIPPHLASQLETTHCLQPTQREHGHITWEMPGELARLLGWLATLPLRHIRIEPIGLRAIYDRFHSEPSRVETPPEPRQDEKVERPSQAVPV